ncbi:MAG: UDP-galactopyranose mutase [Brevinematales bacterium]|nr:UDP-galactopyranose mutase [Brevinematales bacterium]
MFDYCIVGAGFAGAVLAERIAKVLNRQVLLIEKRSHIGGNCFDYRDSHGIIVHKYGPHLFHTDYKEVFDYLSNFTDWSLYQHKVLAYVDGKKVPIPFNFHSMDLLFPQEVSLNLQKQLLKYFEYGSKVPILELKKREEKELHFLADFIYKKIFLYYTMKQWGKKPEDIDPEVTARVPVLVGKDDRYFYDRYQAVPAEGYTKIFERMLDDSRIKIMLNTNFQDVMQIDISARKIYLFNQEFQGKVIFTGPIDELFNYCFGYLPYRSLRFSLRTERKEYMQEVATVNYPNDYDYTRITEFKHIHPVDSPMTTYMYEYPESYEFGKIPYYPLFTPEAKGMYDKYAEMAKGFENLLLVGRLAEYRYYDMDDVIKRALDIFEEEIR